MKFNGHAASSPPTNNFYPPFYKPEDGAPKVAAEGEIDYPFEDVTSGGDENKIRGNWASKVDFILSCLGFTVGLGNLWRFPYYCYKNGGGTFLVPYFVMLIFAGMPIFFMELSVGQFASLGCVSVWKVCPMFKGVGIAMFLVSCCIAIYFTMVMAWTVFYLTHSVRATLPWATCGHEWNTDDCYVMDRTLVRNCSLIRGVFLKNGSCFTESDIDDPYVWGNLTSYVPSNASRTLPSDEYFHNYVLEITDSLENVGSIRWQLALCLLMAWAIVFICLFKSIKTSGKVVYITTVAPYVILLVLFVRAMTLDGALEGVMEFFSFEVAKLIDPRVWGDAAVQVFFSLSCCWGGLITLSSYNKFHNDSYKDMWLVCMGDVLTSVFAGLVTFAIIGTMAYSADMPYYEVVRPGPGLAFVVYAEALARLPIAPLWAVLFFLMLLSIGIDTQFFVMETVVTSICDEFPERLRKNHRHVLALCSVLFYAAGVPLCTQGGMYLYRLLDYFALNWSLLIIGFFECMAISWVYGVDNFMENVKWMIGYYPPPYIYWKVMWKFVTPLLLMAIMLFTWIAYEDLRYEPLDYPYPAWANLVGWGVSFVCVLAIPLAVIGMFCKAQGSCVERMRDLIIPQDDWGPALAIHRAEQYPLQVPEAREPLRGASDDGSDDQDGADMVQKYSWLDDPYGQHPGFNGHPYELLANGAPSIPEFDKETAI